MDSCNHRKIRNGKHNYKYCMVPLCPNTSATTKEKRFFVVPRIETVRKQWCTAIRRSTHLSKLSNKTVRYVCEDHFNLSVDARKLPQHLNERVLLKKGTIPHKFECQIGADGRDLLNVVDQNPCSSKSSEVFFASFEPMSPCLSDIDESALQLINQPQDHVELEALEKPQCSGRQILQQHGDGHQDTSSSEENFHILVVEHATDSKAIQCNMKKKFKNKFTNTGKEHSRDASLYPIKCLTSRDVSTSPLKHCKNTKSVQLNQVTLELDSSASESASDSEYSQQATSDSYADTNLNGDFKSLSLKLTLQHIENKPKLYLGILKDFYWIVKTLAVLENINIINVLIVLKKIKLNSSFSILGDEFGLSEAQASRIFKQSLPKISRHLAELVFWPKTETIEALLPIPFRARYKHVVSIIDCFEIQIEKPSNPLQQALTWSEYKKCNTLKYLISITPDGFINFISKGFGGRTTDMMIVEKCGYLNNLSEGMSVMADRGFKQLATILEGKHCQLVRPPSVVTGVNSTKVEVKLSKQIAALRIHVERVISRLREYHILKPHSCIDFHLTQDVDHIVIIACGLINLQKPIT